MNRYSVENTIELGHTVVIETNLHMTARHDIATVIYRCVMVMNKI